jgi:hypothetical protein
VGKKWYSYFVVTDEDSRAEASTGADTVGPRRVTDIVPETDVELPRSIQREGGEPPDLSLVYESAKIAPPVHGYTVLKVAEMLESEHIKALPSEVKRKSILVALDAAGVKIQEIVEDAVRRDRALDTYERVLEKHLDGLRAQTAAENRKIEEEIAQRMADLRARAAANQQKVEREEREFLAWRTHKHREEEAIAHAVSYFVSESPITLPARSAKDKGDADVR